MKRRASIEREVRAEVARLAASGLSPEPLARQLMAAVQRAVPGDGFRLFALDPATHLVNWLLAASDNDAWARVEWLRDFYLAPSPLMYIQHEFLLQRRITAVAIQQRQEECWGYPADALNALSPREHYRSYHEIRSPMGGVVLVHIPADGRWVAVLQLYRRDSTSRFAPKDVAFLERIAPAIGSALASALSRERALASSGIGQDQGASGVLILTPDWRVTVATPAAEQWLGMLDDADRGGHAPLPTAVWSAIAQLRTTGEPSTVSAPAAGSAFRVEASPAGLDGSVAIVLAPHRPHVPPAMPETWSLTPQERRVVELLLRGLANREIAARLFVSENTVEFHLRHVYDKLDVRGRNQILARFFQETFLPSFESDDDLRP